MQLFRFYGTFSGTANSQGLYTSPFFRVPNPGLRPEKATTYELGAEIKPARETNVQFNMFHTTVSDMILSAATPTVQSNFVPGGTIAYTEWAVNLGEIRAYGLDASIDHKFTRGDWWVDSWLNASYVNGDLYNPTTGVMISLPQTSNVGFNAGLTYNRGERLIITPSLRWVGETNTYTRSPTSAGFGAKAPAYADTSLYAEYKILRDKFSVFTRITNLLDEKIYNVSGGSGNNLAMVPQDRRWIMAGLKYQF
jgi:outer membrane receptor protein involved in Fe transport